MILLGYYIRCTVKDPHPGKSWCSYPHRLYPTEHEAERALAKAPRHSGYEYDVAPVYFRT